MGLLSTQLVGERGEVEKKLIFSHKKVKENVLSLGFEVSIDQKSHKAQELHKLLDFIPPAQRGELREENSKGFDLRGLD